MATIARNSTHGKHTAIQLKSKKKKVLLQKRDRGNPINFGGIRSLLNRSEVF